MPEEKVGTIEKRYGGEGDDIFIFAGSQYGSFQAANQARQRALERAAEDKPETPATDEPEKKILRG